MELLPGLKVTWRHESRAGYGFVTLVAGVVESVGQGRVTIKVAFRAGHDAPWELVRRHVRKASLLPRSAHVAEVDDPSP